MMDKDTYIKIAGKIADGTASEKEIELYNAYFNAYQLKYPLWNELDALQRKEMIDEAEQGIHVQLRHNDDKKSVRLWPRIVAAASQSKFVTSLIAAAAVAAIVLGVYFFNANTPPRIEFGAGAQDIAPGKNGATITLANGKVIQLSDAKSGVIIGSDLKYSDGAAVQGGGPDPGKSGQALGQDDMMLMTASTAKGQTYHFTLPDGTKVWLNADSKLEFPSNFANGKTRNVKLSGEGYFEVAKDKAHPFMVNFKTLTLTVLGTHFNVNAYENEKIAKATLLEGSIKVEKLFLKPAQQAIFDDHKRLSLQTLENAEKEIAWKDGYFRFYDEKIQDIMKKLERWYDIEVVYEGKMTNEGFTGKVSRNKNISQVLMILERTKGVHFKIDGRRVTVID